MPLTTQHPHISLRTHRQCFGGRQRAEFNGAGAVGLVEQHPVLGLVGDPATSSLRGQCHGPGKGSIDRE